MGDALSEGGVGSRPWIRAAGRRGCGTRGPRRMRVRPARDANAPGSARPLSPAPGRSPVVRGAAGNARSLSGTTHQRHVAVPVADNGRGVADSGYFVGGPRADVRAVLRNDERLRLCAAATGDGPPARAGV